MALLNPFTGQNLYPQVDDPANPTEEVDYTFRSPFTGADVTSTKRVPVGPDPVDDLTDSTTLYDYGKSIMAGGAGVGAGLGWLIKSVAPGESGLEDFGQAIETYGNDAVDYWNESMSPAAQREMAKEFITKDENGEYQWGDASMATVGLFGAQSLLGTAAGAGIGAGATKMLQIFGNPIGRGALSSAVESAGARLGNTGTAAQKIGAVAMAAANQPELLKKGELAAFGKLKMVDKVMGALGFGIGEGSIGGVMTGVNVEKEIMRLDIDTLMKSPRFNQILDASEGLMDEALRIDYARETLAKESATVAAYQSGALTALLGAPMGAYFGPMFSRVGIGRAGGVLKGAAGEAAQEFGQSAGEAYITNKELIAAGDPRDIFDDVLNQAVGGAAAGGLIGGGFGFSLKGDQPIRTPRKKGGKAAPAGEVNLGPLQKLGAEAIAAGVPPEDLAPIVQEAIQPGGMMPALRDIRELIAAKEAEESDVDSALDSVDEARPKRRKGKRKRKSKSKAEGELAAEADAVAEHGAPGAVPRTVDELYDLAAAVDQGEADLVMAEAPDDAAKAEQLAEIAEQAPVEPVAPQAEPVDIFALNVVKDLKDGDGPIVHRIRALLDGMKQDTTRRGAVNFQEINAEIKRIKDPAVRAGAAKALLEMGQDPALDAAAPEPETAAQPDPIDATPEVSDAELNDPAKIWKGELTESGRADLLRHAGIGTPNEPDVQRIAKISWENLSENERKGIAEALPTFEVGGVTLYAAEPKNVSGGGVEPGQVQGLSASELAELGLKDQTKEEMMAELAGFFGESEPETGQLSVRFGDQTYPVASLEDASRKWNEFRAASGEPGASALPRAQVVDADGNVVADIAYNGRIFPPKTPEALPAPSAAEPENAPEAVEAPAEQAETAISLPEGALGLNEDGLPVYETDTGVRSYVEDGIRVSESVAIRPGAGLTVDVANRKSEFKTAEESAGEAVPGLPRSQIDFATGLSEEHAAVQERFADFLESTPWTVLVARYGALTEAFSPEDTRGGQILSTDAAKELFDEYVQDRTLSAGVQEPASAFIKELYRRRLKQSVVEGMAPEVIFTSGGTGAGKTSLQSAAGASIHLAHIIYDGNFANVPSAKGKIKDALDADLNVRVLYVYKNPVAAYGAVIRRYLRLKKDLGSGRPVPISAHAGTHVGSQTANLEYSRIYEGNEHVRIIAYDNSGGRGNARQVPIAEIPVLDYNEVVEGARNVLEEYKDQLTDAEYQSFLGESAQEVQESARPGRAGRTERTEQNASPEVQVTDEGGVENAIQDALPDSDAGAGPGNVQPSEADGGDGTARTAESGGSRGDVRSADGGRTEVTEQLPEGAIREPGGETGVRGVDRVPEPGSGNRGPTSLDAVKGENYVIKQGALAEERGPTLKARDNIKAIELLRTIEAEGRSATHEEQVTLAKYSGWGGIKGVFPDADGNYAKGLETVGERLKELLSDTEYATAERSQQYAHYTSETVVNAMWSAVQRLGFTGGKVFEPGMGVGNFAGLMPGDVAVNTDYSGLELDHTTARIARLLYPRWGVRQDDFTRSPLPENMFDLVIGNPPFGDIPIHTDAKYPQKFLIHDYFFAKSLDAVRPGGLLAFISSAGTMNKLDTKAREYLADRADLVAAVRLPGDAFKKSANTQVTTDILFFRKRLDGDTEASRDWTETVKVTLPTKDGGSQTGNVNRYFQENPDMVLGEEGFFDKLYPGRYGVRSVDQNLFGKLKGAIESFPENVMLEWADPQGHVEIDFGTAEKKDGSYYLKDGALMQQRSGVGVPAMRRKKGVKGGKTKAEFDRIMALIPIRDALRAVFVADLAEDAKTGDVARKRLNDTYDAFVDEFGPINELKSRFQRPSMVELEGLRSKAREEARYIGAEWLEGSFSSRAMVQNGATLAQIARFRKAAREAAKSAGRPFDEGTFNPNDVPDKILEKHPNIDPFIDDPENYRLRAIEKYEDATGVAKKGPIFSENVMAREPVPEINSVHDALLWTLNQKGHMDIPELARMANVSEDEAIAELGNEVYKVPGTEGQWEIAGQYLSGNVKNKLAIAQDAAQTDIDLQRNVEALEAVQPLPLPPTDIRVKLGMPWIPTDVLDEFGTDGLGLDSLTVRYIPSLAQWMVTGDERSAAAQSTWGTEDRPAPKLIQDALNRQTPKIYVEYRDENNRPARRVNPEATEAVQNKIDEIKEELNNWVWRDQERSERLVDLYNEEYNNIVVREVDGSYLTTPGIVSGWNWYDHQSSVIARIIQMGNTYMAHAVGAGKTAAMIGAGMEMRRLGLVRKPMYTVPNHMLGQFTKEFYEQYPTAKIAVADERQFHTSRRKQFIANVAIEDLDAIIITHSAFGLIPISDTFQDGLIQEELAKYWELLSDPDMQGGENRITRGKIQTQIERLEQRLAGRGSNRQDQVFTFEEMGVDFLFVDEAHEFRKLDFATKMNNVKGINPLGSNASWNLFVKTRYLETINPGRNLVLASGTPITNTMAELYTVQRYLQPQELERRGLSHFDAWAGAFGDTEADLEQNAAGGYDSVTRFAKFNNVPELSNIVRQTMDVVTSSQLAELVTRPTLKGGKRHMILAEMTPDLEAYRNELDRRLTEIRERRGPPAPGDDIILNVINDGRHSAVDMRLVDPNRYKNDPDSKLNLMVDKVFAEWESTKQQAFYGVKKGGGYTDEPVDYGPATQLVFAELGLSGTRGFSVPEYMRAELVRRGVPREEIMYIGDVKNHIAKQRLFNDMNEGKVRILIGSTAKMGTGMNVQRRLSAIHNMSPLWFPSADEQRNGRGLRQGNMNRELTIFDYSTVGTYDSTMWQLMERKARFIEGFFRGDPNLRDMDDLGEASQYAQAKAMTTNDPRLMELTELRDKLEKAERLRSAFQRSVYAARQRIADAHSTIQRHEKRIPQIQTDIARRTDIRGDRFTATLKGESYDTRVEFGEALLQQIDLVQSQSKEVKRHEIGMIGGLPFSVEMFKAGSEKYVRLYMELTGTYTDSNIRESAVATTRGLENITYQFEGWIKYAEQQIAKANKDIKEFTPKTAGKFDGQKEIDDLTQRVHDLEAQIGGDSPADIAPDDDLPGIEPDSEYSVLNEAEWAIEAGFPAKEDGEEGSFGVYTLGMFKFSGQPEEGFETRQQAQQWVRQQQARPPVNRQTYAGYRGQQETPLLSRRNLGLFSGLLKAAEGLKQAKGQPLQMLKAITNFGGAKQAEIEWVGLPEFLRTRGKSVTKQELVEFIKANGVQVEEVRLGRQGAPLDAAERAVLVQLRGRAANPDVELDVEDQSRLDELNQRHSDAVNPAPSDFDLREAFSDEGYGLELDDYTDTFSYTDFANDLNGENVEFDELPDRLQSMINRLTDAEGRSVTDGPPQFGSYVLQGESSNYREVMLRMPQEGVGASVSDDQIKWLHNQLIRRNYPGVNAETRQVLSSPTTQAFEMLDDWEARLGIDVSEARAELTGNVNKPTGFNSGHYGEIGNVLMWMRLNDRTGPNGEKILHVEEFQSAWDKYGQQGGFGTGPIAELAAANKAVDDAWSDALEALRVNDNLGFDSVAEALHGMREANEQAGEYQSGRWLDQWEVNAPSDALVINNYLDASVERQRLQNLVSSKAVPDMPFKGNAWVELGIKRAIRMAAEEGYDSISWTTGAQQADRYNLAKHVEKISYRTDNEHLAVYDKEGTTVLSELIEPENLEEYIGKELAERLLASPVEPAPFIRPDGVTDGLAEHYQREHEADNRWSHQLKGVDLKIGGEGMNSFYDRTVPNLMRKIVKKLDPAARIGEADISGERNQAVRVQIQKVGDAGVEVRQSSGPERRWYVVRHGEWGTENFATKPEAEAMIDLQWGVATRQDGGNWNFEGAYGRFDTESAAETRMAEMLEQKKQDSVVHNLPISDKMREGAMAGLPLFDKGAKPAGLTQARVAGLLAKPIRAVAPILDVRVVQSTADLPGNVTASDVEGAYYNGGAVYLVADNLTEERVPEVFRHEVFGHAAMERLDQFPRWLKQIQRAKGLKGGTIKRLAAEVAARHGTLDPTTEAKEIIALMAEQGVKSSLMDRIIAVFRKILRSLGLVKNVSEADIREMIATGMREFKQDIDLAQALPQHAAAFESALRPGATADEIMAAITAAYPDDAVEQRRAVLYQRMLHGSTAEFDRFSLDYIGSGEGAQAFGWGIYFAENEKVAHGYKTAGGRFAPDVTVDGEKVVPVLDRISLYKAAAEGRLDGYIAVNQRVLDKAKAANDDRIQTGTNARIAEAEALRGADVQFKEREGRLYEVTLPDEVIDRMLDWDAPLSEQPANVRRFAEENFADEMELTGGEAYRKAAFDLAEESNVLDLFNELAGPIMVKYDMPGDFGLGETIGSFAGRLLTEFGSSLSKAERDVFVQFQQEDPQRMTSEYLNREYEIPGIKYYDGQSRNAGTGGGFIKPLMDWAAGKDKRTRNIVLFDPSLITETKRDGKTVSSEPLLSQAPPIARLRQLKNQHRAVNDEIAKLRFDDMPSGGPEAGARMANLPDPTGPAVDRFDVLMDQLRSINAEISQLYESNPEILDEGPRPLLSRAGAMGGRAVGNEDVEDAMARVMVKPNEDLTVADRVRRTWRKLTDIQEGRIQQGFLDSGHAIKMLEEGLFGEVLDATDSAYKAFLATNNLPSVMAAVLKVGAPEVAAGAFKQVDGRKGVIEIFRPLGDHADGNLMAQWEFYAAGVRASRLINERNEDGSSKEKNFTQDDIDLALGLADQYPEFKTVFDEWQVFNDQILDMAESAGVINKAERAVWQRNDYVPFYRALSDEEGIQSPGKRGGIEGQRSGIRRLIGGEDKLNSVFENMMMNTAHLIDSSFKNIAMQRTTEMALETDALEKMPPQWEPKNIELRQMEKRLAEAGIEFEELSPAERRQMAQIFVRVTPQGPDIVSALWKGKPTYYRVKDPMLLSSVSSMGHESLSGIMSLLRAPKKWLTVGVTASPEFMLANLIRDSLSTWVVSDVNKIPIIDSLKGLSATFKGDENIMAIMMAGAGGGGFYDSAPDDIRKLLEQKMPRKSVKGHINKVLSPRNIWRFWQKVGASTENATRVAVFKRVMENGGSLAEAAYQARDVLNFTMHGDFAAMRVLTQSVPFLNARIQGLYRLQRGYKENPKAFVMKGSILFAATMALLLRNNDRDEYEERPDWEKDVYWHIFLNERGTPVGPLDHWLIPKPFEVGSLFATVPERIQRLSTGRDDWALFQTQIATMISETLAFNPTPQIAKPMIEQFANRSIFTGSPIVGLSLNHLEPEAQYNAWTSEFARVVAEGMPDGAPAWLRSPKRLQHAVRAYFGTLGTYVLSTADTAVRTTGGYPSRPSKKIYDLPLFKRFLKDPNPRYTKYSNQMYEMVDEANSLYSTINRYREQGLMEKAKELQAENVGKLSVRKRLNKLVGAIRKINNAQRMVMYSSKLSPDEKRVKLDALTKKKNDIVRSVAPFEEWF